MAKTLSSLGWDYFSFIIFVVFSTVVPVWNDFRSKKQKAKKDFVFATGGISLIAVMLSIGRGTLGVRSVLGYPAELFYRGSAMWETIYGMITAYPVVCFIFVPVYFNLGITSVYQYLDLRFKSNLVRCLASGTYIVRQVFSIGITTYTPSIALSAAIGIPFYMSIMGMSAIFIFFTVVGGLKAAIYADVIQTLSVITVSLVVITLGTIDVGGPKTVIQQNYDNGRLQFMNFTGDMSVRVDTTSAWVGQLFMSLSLFGCQQNFMQRYLSLASTFEVKKAMMSNIPLIFVFFSFSWLSGMVIYATYFDCDPLKAGYINKFDEIFPFYVEDRLSYLPGFLGLFVATLFNGALSLNVSNLNAVSTVMWEDFVKKLPKFKNFNDTQELMGIKVIAVIFGILSTLVAFGAAQLAGIIEFTMLTFSATSGPLLGVFILAMLVPIANWKGASAGMIATHILIIWIIIGGSTVNKPKALLPTSVEGCSDFDFSPDIYKTSAEQEFTRINNSTTNLVGFAPVEKTPLENFYMISYMYYGLLGSTCTVLVGILVSCMTRSQADLYPAKLLNPTVVYISELFPGSRPYYFEKAPSMENVVVTKDTKTNDTLNIENLSKDSNHEIYRKHNFE